MTIANVITKSRYLLADTDTPYRWGDGEMLKHAFEAERQAVNMLPGEAVPLLWATTKKILVSGVNTYPIPTDMHRLSAMKVYTSPSRTIATGVRLNPQERENLQWDNQYYEPSSTFQVAVFKDGSMELRPTPSVTIVDGVEYSYIQKIVDGNSTDSLLVADSVGDAMAWYAAALALEFEDPDRADRYKGRFNEMIAAEGVRYVQAPTAVRGGAS